MQELVRQARDFMSDKALNETARRLQTACMLVTGMDATVLIALPTGERDQTVARLRRLLKRERLKGLRGHWSYNLHRHLALKQALDHVMANGGAQQTSQIACLRDK